MAAFSANSMQAITPTLWACNSKYGLQSCWLPAWRARRMGLAKALLISPATSSLQEVASSIRKQPRSGAAAKQSKQTLDYTALAACCHELTNSWVPSKVEEVVQPDRYTLCLRLRTPLTQRWLHLSWHPTAARVCLGQPPIRGDVAEAFSFAEQAYVQLKGLVLVSAGLPAPWERVVQLDFGNRPGDIPSRRLMCEVMAKYSNVILTGGNGTIIQCGYQVGGSMSSLRQVQQGRQYQLPPPATGVQPTRDEPAAAWCHNITQAATLAAAERLQQSAAPAAAHQPASAPKPMLLAGATRAYMGVSPSLVEELCLLANVSPIANPTSLTEDDWHQLHKAWLSWHDRIHSKNFVATSCPKTGKFSVIGTYPQGHQSVHDLVNSYYCSIQVGEVYAGLLQRLTSAVKQALKKARGRVRSFEQQLEAAEGAAAVQKEADIIVANIYRIPEGASQLQAEDWDTGQPVTLQLDPPKSPMEQAEVLYRKARKLRRAVAAVKPLLAAAQQELEYLETAELELAQMPAAGTEQDLMAIKEVQEELIDQKIIKPPPEAALAAKAAAKGRKAQRKQQKSSALPLSVAAAAAATGGAGLRQYRSPGGFVVFVGRNNKQNDVLSHQIAKAGDMWMHVRGLPGSHTVLKVTPGKEPSEDDLQYAADLAAYFSKGRDAGKVDVIVARAEHLKKPKAAKPGQVLVTKEEGNIVARPSSSAAS
eukprot:GHRR01018713.1.p1 GENE.GHRR01018713.1~~GHRR01018713.1.p1  ORF type:complete len:705 (+),score=256.20 GHRR01018713.1:640-2754(+)